MEHSFLSFGFTTMVFYGVISIPLYIATIVIIIRKKTLNGSFYTIYIASGIAVRFFPALENPNLRNLLLHQKWSQKAATVSPSKETHPLYFAIFSMSPEGVSHYDVLGISSGKTILS